MNTSRLIAQIAASPDGVPVRGGLAVGYCDGGSGCTIGGTPAEHAVKDPDATGPAIQIRRPDGSTYWVPARQVRRA